MPQDAVQEFKVYRNQFDAQYGAALNAVVNVVTKSGGNSPSGTGYYFGRDKALNARNAKAATVPPFKQTRVGGTYGGPIVRNRTHMFARVRVPDHRQGGHRLAAGQQSVRRAAERQLSVQRHRAPGRRQSRPPVQRRPVGVRPLRLRQPVHAERRARRTPPVDRRQQQVAQHRRRAQLGAVAEHGQHAARPLPRPQPVHRADQLRPADRPAVVHLRAERRGAAVFSRARSAASSRPSTSTRRSHDIKIGGEFTHASSNFEAHFTEHGAFTFLTDTPFNAADSRTWPFTFVQQTPGFYNYSSNQIAAFVQDDWRVTDRLRLNLGLRYDLDTSLRQNDLYESLLANPALHGLEQLRQRPIAATTPTTCSRASAPPTTSAATARWWRGRPPAVHDPQPAVAPADLDGQDAGVAVRITDPQLLQNYPDINAVLGGKTLDEYRAAPAACARSI